MAKRSRRVKCQVATPSKLTCQASWNTKQVETPRRSITKVSQKQGQSVWKNESKASWPRPAKRQAMLKTSEVQRWTLQKDALVNADHQLSTKVLKSTERRRQPKTNLSLSCWRSNELQKGGWLCQNGSYRQAQSPVGGGLPRHTEDSNEKFTEKLTSEVLPTRQKPNTMKSTKKLRQLSQQVEKHSTETTY